MISLCANSNIWAPFCHRSIFSVFSILFVLYLSQYGLSLLGMFGACVSVCMCVRTHWHANVLFSFAVFSLAVILVSFTHCVCSSHSRKKETGSRKPCSPPSTRPSHASLTFLSPPQGPWRSYFLPPGFEGNREAQPFPGSHVSSYNSEVQLLRTKGEETRK